MRLMSHMSSIEKRARWWTPTHDTTRDVHLSRGTSGQRPPQWTETMAAYHRLITPSSTTSANHTPHTRPHSVLSISTSIILSPHESIYSPFIPHYTQSRCLTPNSAFICEHTPTQPPVFPPTHTFPPSPSPLFAYINHHTMYLLIYH